MIQESLSFKLMKGFRGQPVKDLNALADGIVQASRIFLANPWIKEMEFNPVAVLDEGRGIKILDALIVGESE
jgi:acetyltransferase